MVPNQRGVQRVVTAGLLLAITLLLTFTRIGMIPVPTPAGNATISHIPAIIGGILEGPLVGLIVGMGFGFASYATATTPMFKDPLVAVLPRLFIGVASYYMIALLYKANRKTLQTLAGVLWALLLVFSWQIGGQTLWLGILVALVSTAAAIAAFIWLQKEDTRIVALAIASVVGSFTNTVLVLGMAVFRAYLTAEVALAVGLVHGVPEAIISAIITVAVVATLRQINRKKAGSKLVRENSSTNQ